MNIWFWLFSCLELTACLPSGAIEGAAWKHKVLNDAISGYPEDFLLACVTLLDCESLSRCAVQSLVGLCRTTSFGNRSHLSVLCWPVGSILGSRRSPEALGKGCLLDGLF